MHFFLCHQRTLQKRESFIFPNKIFQRIGIVLSANRGKENTNKTEQAQQLAQVWGTTWELPWVRSTSLRSWSHATPMKYLSHFYASFSIPILLIFKSATDWAIGHANPSYSGWKSEKNCRRACVYIHPENEWKERMKDVCEIKRWFGWQSLVREIRRIRMAIGHQLSSRLAGITSHWLIAPKGTLCNASVKSYTPQSDNWKKNSDWKNIIMGYPK